MDNTELRVETEVKGFKANIFDRGSYSGLVLKTPKNYTVVMCAFDNGRVCFTTEDAETFQTSNAMEAIKKIIDIMKDKE